MNTRDLEIDLLLTAIQQQYGYDFSNYSKTSLRNRIQNFCEQRNITYISSIIQDILHDRNFFWDLLKEFTVITTEFFRDPLFFIELRKHIIPILKTYPYIKIWIAGCATGEEAYSLAILLQEEQLLNKTWIYATDINKPALDSARRGIYSSHTIAVGENNYKLSQGKSIFNSYFCFSNESFQANEELKQRIVFSEHNLVCDNVFTETNLILCRNVLIYFNKSLQDGVLALLDQSLCAFGFLCLGSKETLYSSTIEKNYECMSEHERLYRKK